VTPGRIFDKGIHEMSEVEYGWIRLDGHRIERARIGVYPEERESPPTLVVDVGLWAPVLQAANSELLEDTIDYDQIAELTKRMAAERHFNLLETFAETLAANLLQALPPALKVSIAIHKPLASGATASVAIERHR